MKTIKRRDFLRNGTAAIVAGLSPASVFAISESAHTARLEARPIKLFDKREARLLDAITERIIPRTKTPGAHDLGVIHFIDRACEDEWVHVYDFIKESLADFETETTAAHPAVDGFADLDPALQDAFLRTQESTPFFGLIGLLTRFGYYGMSKYGGNAGEASWPLLGYRGHNGGWEYPFGEYDAEAHGTNRHE